MGEETLLTRYKYFTDEEAKGLDTGLMVMLDQARGIAGVPFVITSGLRTVEENDALAESVKDSAHITGNAVDLECEDSMARFAMLKALFSVGFTRIGIYKQHLHVDNSQTLPQQVCWYVVGN